MEILRKVKCSERLPENNIPVYLQYGVCHGVYYRYENQWVKQNTQNKERLSVLEYPECNNYWYEPIDIELKSEEILPINKRFWYTKLCDLSLNDKYEYVEQYHKALEAAELENIVNMTKIEQLERRNRILEELHNIKYKTNE